MRVAANKEEQLPVAHGEDEKAKGEDLPEEHARRDAGLRENLEALSLVTRRSDL